MFIGLFLVLTAITKALPLTWERRNGTDVYYSYVNTSVTMRDAHSYCLENDGSLVSIISEDENNYINARYKRNSNYIRIGLSDERQEGRWEWVDGTKNVYIKWGTNEPSGGTNENCVALCQCSDAWVDIDCSIPIPFICKKVIPINNCANKTLNDCQQICIDTYESYTCSCEGGYLYQTTDGQVTCTDIDECSNKTLNDCQENCTNTNGGYICTCFDGHNNITVDGQVNCIVPIEVKTFDVNGSKSIKANYGDSVVLHCEVTGSGGTFAVLSGPELSTFKNHTLNTAVIDKPLANLNCKDSGRYFCWGQNGGGEKSLKDYVDINITCLVEPPPVYQGKQYQPQKQITVSSEKNTTFEFVVYGYPEPTSYDLRIQTKSNSYTDVNSTHYDVRYMHLEPPFGLVTLTIFDENTKETITYVLGINSEKGRVNVTVEVVKVIPKPPKDDTTTQMAIGIGVGVGGFLIIVVIVVVCTVKCRRSRTPAVTRGVPMEQLYDKAGPVYNDRHYALAYENKIANDYDLPQN